MKPRQPTLRVPHNKSDRARDAERRGEHTWANWRLADLIDQVLRVNNRGLSEEELRAVRNVEILKVKLLEPTATHHTKLRMDEPLTLIQDQFYGLKTRTAATLDGRTVAAWRGSFKTAEELDEAVKNLTGRLYYRKTRL